MFRIKIFFTLFALIFCAMCAQWSAVYANEKPNVVVTTGMIADAVSNIADDLVNIKVLMGSGVDPHAYRQTRSDIVALANANLVLWNGLYLEAQMEEFLLELANDRPVLAVAERVPNNLLIGSDEYDGRYDPHLWMDPRIWSFVVLNVRDALTEILPEEKTRISDNTETYLKKVEQLQDYANRVLASVPQKNRVLLTSHDAFNYFGQAYGYNVIGIQGISTESEAGLKRISELVDLIIEKNVQAVFVETSVSDRNIRALVEGVRAKGYEVSIGGELFSDAMGEPGSYEGTYIGMIDSNSTTIATALGGDAPTAGMLNKLN
ncbi:MAG: manganese transporter [Rhodobiaceae bacterium]|nr:manganese transporter [Rhodobiaceae bacterium]